MDKKVCREFTRKENCNKFAINFAKMNIQPGFIFCIGFVGNVVSSLENEIS
jgi:hypothetical protein